MPVETRRSPRSSSERGSGGGTLSRTSMTGFYKVSASGGNCRVGLTLTQYDGDYSAASMGCPGTTGRVRRWSTSGNQVQLKDPSGRT